MTVQREYGAAALDPATAGAFASAAVMATLHPDDWQVCQDADSAAETMCRSIAPTATTTIEVTMHTDRVVVVLRSGERREESTVRPRSAFTTRIECDLVDGDMAASTRG